MTKHDLKEMKNLGAELGAAKAEVERLRELLRDVEFRGLLTGWEPGLIGQITADLSQQPEPTDTYTAVDMATATAQGFRDGQAAVEQATAPDLLSSYEAMGDRILAAGWRPETDAQWDGLRRMHAEYAAPFAQTAPQPEQSGLVEAALRKAVAYLDENPFNEIASGSILHRVMGAALSTTPIPAMAAKEA